jgi:hypothetical protein
MTKDIFDFADLSDLPEELQGKLTRDTDEAVKAWAALVNAGAARGFLELSINQIIAVATRSGLEVPTQQTVRNYLNRAIELKLIGKPTRMSYGPYDPAVPVAVDAEVEEAVAAPEVDEDPLAGL